MISKKYSFTSNQRRPRSTAHRSTDISVLIGCPLFTHVLGHKLQGPQVCVLVIRQDQEDVGFDGRGEDFLFNHAESGGVEESAGYC